MKILHTSDWHLGKRLENRSRLDEQKDVLAEISTIADRENVDAVIIAGDLFDTYNPSVDALELGYRYLKKLTNGGRRPVIVIAGNHDSPDRIDAPDPIARECGIFFIGYPQTVIPETKLETGLQVRNTEAGFAEFSIPGCHNPLRVFTMPYANEFRLRTYLGVENEEENLRQLLQDWWKKLADQYADDQGINLLMTHLFMIEKGTLPPDEPEDEKPILHVGGAQEVYTEQVPDQIQYTALGHLHRMHFVDAVNRKVWYSGSPLSYSFAEAEQKKYVLLVEAEPGGKAEVCPVELTAGKILSRYRAHGIDDAAEWLKGHPDCLVELTIVTDDYLTAAQRRQLNSLHDGIISVIPEINQTENPERTSGAQVDLSRNMEELFQDYFKHEKGQNLNAELLDLFREIIAGQPGEE